MRFGSIVTPVLFFFVPIDLFGGYFSWHPSPVLISNGTTKTQDTVARCDYKLLIESRMVISCIQQEL
jgi:hypothetical protein